MGFSSQLEGVLSWLRRREVLTRFEFSGPSRLDVVGCSESTNVQMTLVVKRSPIHGLWVNSRKARGPPSKNFQEKAPSLGPSP